VAFTFDDGPTPFTDRLLKILVANDAKATFFLIGNKVARDPRAVKRIADAGMEVGDHTWEHPNMSTIPAEDIPSQLSKANDAITAATGRTPNLFRPAGGLSNDAVRSEAGRQGMAEILWDVIPFDWINDSNTTATIYMLKTQIKPGSVVRLHDTDSSTVDLVYQFLPAMKANGYHLVTASHLLGARQPGSRVNGPPASDIIDIPAARIPTLPATPSPKPAPNLPITDIPNQNPAARNNPASERFSTDVQRHLGGVQDTAGLELNEQSPVARVRKVGIDGQGGTAMVPVHGVLRVQMRKRQICGSDGGDVSIGSQIGLQIGHWLAVAAERERQGTVLPRRRLPGKGHRVPVDGRGVTRRRDRLHGDIAGHRQRRR
jgi:peptidoglycan/xylan/chitin deacetylase (PgdA/CDA1 family)